jgi:shikimate kinase
VTSYPPRPRRNERNLVLIGFMATGKSTIGRRCAQALRFQFRDSDSVVECRTGKSVAQLFEEDGEERFRSLESDAIRDLARERRTVIATGGGAILNGANIARLRRTGHVILLWTDPEEILARCGSRATRPLLASADDPVERITNLLSRRESLYRSAAHTVVETTGLSRDEAVSRVLDAYHALACPPRIQHNTDTSSPA